MCRDTKRKAEAVADPLTITIKFASLFTEIDGNVIGLGEPEELLRMDEPLDKPHQIPQAAQ
jgi:hypothetical protein